MCFNIENSIQYWNSIQFNIEIQFKLEYLIIKHNFEQEVALIFCSYVLIFKNGQCKPEFHYNSESLNKILNRFCTLILQTLVSRFQIWGCTPSSTHLFKISTVFTGAHRTSSQNSTLPSTQRHLRIFLLPN